jgi:hypothetical protein
MHAQRETRWEDRVSSLTPEKLAGFARRVFPCFRLPPSYKWGLPSYIARLYPVPKLGKGNFKRDSTVAWTIGPNSDNSVWTKPLARRTLRVLTLPFRCVPSSAS